MESDLIQNGAYNRAVAKVAINEWIFFGRNTRTLSGEANIGLSEYDNRVYHRIFHYWNYAVNKNYTGKDRKWPWSGVYISFCHKTASTILGVESPLVFTASHCRYINGAFRNRNLIKDIDFLAKPILVGYYLDEVKPQVGDLIGDFRLSVPKTIPKNYKLGRYMDLVPSSYPSHCDIVTHVMEDSIFLTGGNLYQSVTKYEVSLDENGYLDSKDHYFILRTYFPKLIEPKILI